MTCPVVPFFPLLVVPGLGISTTSIPSRFEPKHFLSLFRGDTLWPPAAAHRWRLLLPFLSCELTRCWCSTTTSTHSLSLTNCWSKFPPSSSVWISRKLSRSRTDPEPLCWSLLSSRNSYEIILHQQEKRSEYLHCGLRLLVMMQWF